jgi:UTP--glucose-1-phosphate uridylyltransferase
MTGTGHALILTQPFVGNEPFVVAYPDDLHFGSTPLAAQLIEVFERTGCCVLSTIQVEPPELNRYGVVSPADDGLHVTDIVEKPVPGEEPSREASIGRYLYTPELFEHLNRGARDHSEGEYYHTWALKRLIEEGKVVFKRIAGRRFDLGEPEGYLRAIMRSARDDPGLLEALREESLDLFKKG